MVPDPQIENLNLELTERSVQVESYKIDQEIQNAIIKQLERELETKLSEKNKELEFSKSMNDELISSVSGIEDQNEKLQLELEVQKKENENLTNELTNFQSQLAESQAENIEITHLLVDMKVSSHEQISGLQSDIQNLNERLDLFRNEFVTANNKLQVQIHENEIIKNERDSLLCQNSKLARKAYRRKNQRAAFSKKFRKIIHLRKYKRKRPLLSNDAITSKSDGSLKIKLVKSQLTWKCVNLK